jgi:hypothetical protein
MGRVARGAQCRWTHAVHSAIVLAFAIAALALPTSALADAPAQGQYTPPDVSASGGAGHPRSGTGPAVPAASSSGGGNAALPILLGGVVVIGGAGALILYRRQRSDSDAAE